MAERLSTSPPSRLSESKGRALTTQILVATLITIIILRWQERAALGRNRAVR
jgi:hypothetical protein